AFLTRTDTMSDAPAPSLAVEQCVTLCGGRFSPERLNVCEGSESFQHAAGRRTLFYPISQHHTTGACRMRCLSQGERLTYVKTKIIATVGPASESLETLTELVLVGAEIFRLNFAHGTHEWLAGVVKTIRKVSRDVERPIGILGDLAGPKIRLEELPDGVIHCQSGETFEFVRKADPRNPRRLTCTYDRLVDELDVNDRVLLADGT